MREKSRLKLLGFLLAWVVVFAACVSFAQPTVTRGGALKKRAYQTYATMTLYVDPTGSDSNPCTASGTSACLTLAGALGKVPRFIRHNVTVNVAAGTYAEGTAINDFTISRDATLTVQGTWAAMTPTTGAASGTITSSTQASATTSAQLVDSAQSWTTDDLRFKFIRFTSGVQSGNAYPIVRNTATTLTVPNMFGSFPTAGDTYELVTHGSVFSSSGFFSYSSVLGGGAVVLHTLRMVKNGTVWGNSANSPTGLSFTLTQCDVESLGASASSAVAISNAAVYSLVRSLFRSNAVSTQSAAVITSGVPYVLAQSSAVVATGTGSALSAASTGRLHSWIGCYFEAATAASNATIALTTQTLGAHLLLSFSTISCAGSARTGLGPTGTSQFLGRVIAANTYITKCTTGVSLPGGAVLASTVGFSDLTTGVVVSNGGRFSFESAAPTFSSVTNELQVDGTNYTYSFLSGLSPATIVGPTTSLLLK